MTSRVSPRYSINKRGVEQHAKLNQLQAITQIKIKEISIMSNLFTAVSAEQQEIVAGGIVVVPDLSITKDVTYNFNNTSLTNNVSAGFLGASATVDYDNLNVGSTASDTVDQIYFSY
jgi:hypothetical protein